MRAPQSQRLGVSGAATTPMVVSAAVNQRACSASQGAPHAGSLISCAQPFCSPLWSLDGFGGGTRGVVRMTQSSAPRAPPRSPAVLPALRDDQARPARPDGARRHPGGEVLARSPLPVPPPPSPQTGGAPSALQPAGPSRASPRERTGRRPYPSSSRGRCAPARGAARSNQPPSPAPHTEASSLLTPAPRHPPHADRPLGSRFPGGMAEVVSALSARGPADVPADLVSGESVPTSSVRPPSRLLSPDATRFISRAERTNAPSAAPLPARRCRCARPCRARRASLAWGKTISTTSRRWTRASRPSASPPPRPTPSSSRRRAHALRGETPLPSTHGHGNEAAGSAPALRHAATTSTKHPRTLAAAAAAPEQAPTSVIGPADPLVYPEGVSSEVDYEGELGVVIGKGGRFIPRERWVLWF